MASSKAKYQEGDLFAVPLDGGGFAIALITRRGRGLEALGYFYGPRRPSIPSISDLAGITPSNVDWIRLFSALAIKEGSWPPIGRLPGWRREEWPLPGFRSASLLRSRPWRIDLDDKNISSRVSERIVSREEWVALPDDGTSGYRAVEIVLSRRFPLAAEPRPDIDQ